jgi:hypothetical protein
MMARGQNCIEEERKKGTEKPEKEGKRKRKG